MGMFHIRSAGTTSDQDGRRRPGRHRRTDVTSHRVGNGSVAILQDMAHPTNHSDNFCGRKHFGRGFDGLVLLEDIMH